MAQLKPRDEQSDDDRRVEQDEIANFNQNTDYDGGIPEGNDPFSPHNLAIQQFIMSARIYDALLTLVTLQDDETAKDLLELHQAGHILGTAPNFSGVFLTDQMNADDSAPTDTQGETQHDQDNLED